jgi:hypothetical protein
VESILRAMMTACDAPTTATSSKNVAIELMDATKKQNTERIAQKADNGHDNDSDDLNADNDPPCDDAMTTVVPVVDINQTTRPMASEGPNNEDALTDGGADESDENAAVHTMLREASADPRQPSLDHWRSLSGFTSKAVEDAYQASQAPGRALGVAAAAVMWTLWGILTVNFGNATAAAAMMGLDFPVFIVLLASSSWRLSPSSCFMIKSGSRSRTTSWFT